MEEDGVWRTIRGRRVFIAKGQSLEDAMKNSGKFDFDNGDSPLGKYRDKINSFKSWEDADRKLSDNDAKKMYDDFDKWCDSNCKLSEIKKVNEEFMNSANDDKKVSNPLGAYLQKKLKFDGKPKFISEEEFWGKDNTVRKDSVFASENALYRGVSDKKYVDEFKNGEFFAGEGYEANGTYFSKSYSEAVRYSGDEENLICGRLSKDAKIINIGAVNGLKQKISGKMDWSKMIDENSEEQANFRSFVLSDSGYTAMLFGYDAIDMGDNRIVVLNRGAMEVVK